MSNVIKSVSENSVQVKLLDITPLWAIQEGYSVNESNYLNHPTSRTPPFPGKMINYCIPCIQTPTPSGALTGRRTSTSF